MASDGKGVEKVCILGVAGFIGSHLLEMIINKTAWKVIGVDMVEPKKIQKFLEQDNVKARFTFHKLDISKNPKAIEQFVEQCDTVVNLAAICNPSEYIKQPVNTINSNFTDALDCINFCTKHKKHLIHFSTCEVYGRTLSSYGLPKDNPDSYMLDEEKTPLIMGPLQGQRWCYAAAKQLVERLIYANGTENGLKFSIVRPFNFIGPRMDYVPGVDGKDDGQPRVMAAFMTALMKGEPLILVDGGKVFRTFTYIDDACSAIVAMIANPEKSSGHAFNVGNPNNNVSVKDLAELLIRLYSKLTGRPKGETKEIAGTEYYGKGYEDCDLRIPSMRLIQQQLDWKPEVSLEESMERTMKGFLEAYADKIDAMREPAAKKARTA